MNGIQNLVIDDFLLVVFLFLFDLSFCALLFHLENDEEEFMNSCW